MSRQPPEIKIEKQQIRSLQVFRGLAALAVVAHHAVLSTDAFIGKVPQVLAGALNMGYLGVDFFFVLSGFIIMYAHIDEPPSWRAVRRYAVKRLARIFPAYLPIVVGLIGLYAWLPGMSGAAEREYSLLSSLLLVPADRPPALSVAWTLVHELMFYAVFVLWFFGKRWLVAGLLTWGALIAVSAQGSQAPRGWSGYPLSLLNIEFMMGVLAAWFVKRGAFSVRLGKGWQPLAAAGVGVSCIGIVLIVTNATPYARLVFALGLSFLIVGFALREEAARLYWPPLILALGNASYSIYLIHNPLLSGTQRLAPRLGLSWGGGLLLGIGCAVLVGFGYYLAVERPALRYFHKFSRPQ